MRARNMLCAATCCVIVLGGCGSQVPPGQVYGGGRAFGAVPGSTAPGEFTSGAAEVLGAGPSIVPGTGGSTVAGGGGSAGGGSARNATSPASGITLGSCAGFHDGLGISDQAIAIGNIADVTGPVPGLFTSAQQAVQAYQAYFNSTSSICGRKLKVTSYDSQTSAIGDQEASTTACSSMFALVGSVGAFDNGGAGTVAQCGIPDLRTISTNPERFASPVSFGTDAVDPNEVSTVQYRYIKSATGNAAAKSAMVYLNAGAAVPNALAYRRTMESVGYHFVYQQAINVTEFNYAPYVEQMKSLGVTLVQFEGSYQFAVRLKQAMAAQGIDPVFVMDSVAYDPVFVQAGGASLDGMYSYVDTDLFEEASRSPELQLYLTWLHRVAPDATPSFFGMFAWGSMALFATLALELGGRLSRASLLQAIRNVHGYTDNGLFVPQDVGGKASPACQSVVQLTNGSWTRRSPYPYSCGTVFDAVTS